MLDARDVEAVVPGEDVQQHRGVGHAARDRAAVIERHRQWDDAADGHETVRGLQPHDAAVRRRRANRSARVGAERAVAEIRGDGGSRSARRAAGIALERPRIAHRSVIARRRRAAKRELVQIRFADDDRAGGCEAARHLRVFGGHAIVEHGARGRRAHTGRVDVVLEGDRNAVQRTAHAAGAPVGVERSGLRQRRFTRDRDERVDLWVVNVDAREARVHEIDGRHGARLQPRRRFGQREPGERVLSADCRRRGRSRRLDRSGMRRARSGRGRAEHSDRELASREMCHGGLTIHRQPSGGTAKAAGYRRSRTATVGETLAMCRACSHAAASPPATITATASAMTRASLALVS